VPKKDDFKPISKNEFAKQFYEFRKELLEMSKKYDSGLPPLSLSEEMRLFEMWYHDSREIEIMNQLEKDDDEAERWRVDDDDDNN
jgi:hypothetical protein